MTETCPATGDLVDIELGRFATQYRESDRLIGYTRAVLNSIEEAALATCAIPSFFDINTAVGDQLTLIGKRMGFGRCHCVCIPQPVFGFACDPPDVLRPVVGFCHEGSWAQCDEAGNGDLCIYDDEAYRGHLLARRYQMLGLFDIDSLGAAIRYVWGPSAWVVKADRGEVIVSPGRVLNNDEQTRLVLTQRILPVAPGIKVGLWLSTAWVFGFGDGWAGICGSSVNDSVFGFECTDYDAPVTGFCETEQTWHRCLPPPEAQGYWLCPTYIDPYSCP